MVTKEELIKRLRDFEDNFTERKLEGVTSSELRETLVAFANSTPQGRTAVLYIGVFNDGVPQGVSNPDPLQKKVRKICERGCYPPIKYHSEVITSAGKCIVAVVIPHNRDKPHFAGPAYVREDSENIIASPKLFEELITTHVSKAYEILSFPILVAQR